jgi:hypothetical protein
MLSRERQATAEGSSGRALEKQAAELMMTRDTFFSFREIKNRQGCEFHERLTALEQRVAAEEKLVKEIDERADRVSADLGEIKRRL